MFLASGCGSSADSLFDSNGASTPSDAGKDSSAVVDAFDESALDSSPQDDSESDSGVAADSDTDSATPDSNLSDSSTDAPSDAAANGLTCPGLSIGTCATSQVCCLLFATPTAGICRTKNATCDTKIQCDSDTGCPNGQICCAKQTNWVGGTRFESVSCASKCDGDSNVIVCDPNKSGQCKGGKKCTQSTLLPTGYFTCQ
jgi:hypothetical protein